MRKEFREYYSPSGEELKGLWLDGLIILDTNALLNFFRYTDTTRRQFIDLLNSRRESLWIPYQVGLEFHRNRLEVIHQQEKAFDEIEASLSSAENDITKALKKFSRHPSLDTAGISRKLRDSLGAILNVVNDARSAHATAVTSGGNDRTLEEITELFEGRVGEPYTSDKLAQLYTEGQVRYADKIPPGYEDSSKPEPDRYGDLVLWQQILEMGANSKRPAIFVTDDNKEDWWLKSHGKTVGPRTELVDEYFASADARIHFYSPERFLQFAKDSGSAVSAEAVSEAEELSSARSTARAAHVLAERREQLLEEQERIHRSVSRVIDADSPAPNFGSSPRAEQMRERLAALHERRALLEAQRSETIRVARQLGYNAENADAEAYAHRLEEVRKLEAEIEAESAHLSKIMEEEERLYSRRREHHIRSLRSRLDDVNNQLSEVTLALSDLSDES